MTVYERIKEIAKKRGMNLQTVAKNAGLSSNMIYQYKTVNPKMDTLKTLADVLGVSTDYLLGNTNEMHENKSTPTNTDLENMLDGAVAYGGKPMSDNDRTILKGMLKAYFDNKED